MPIIERLDVDKPGKERLRYRELRRMYERMADRIEKLQKLVNELTLELTQAKLEAHSARKTAEAALGIAATTQNELFETLREAEADKNEAAQQHSPKR